MDSDSFFEFDASIPPEDGGLEAGVLESEEYDALNDETFGSAMVDGDWEEGHEQMASIAEARKRDGAGAAHHHLLQQHKSHEDDGGLLGELRNFGLGRYDSNTSSAPISMVGYSTGSHPLLGGPELPGSPSGSIWTPSPGVDKLRPVTHSAPPSNGLNRTLGPLPGLAQAQPQPSLSSHMGLPTIKTVAELEEEMKLQHVRTQPGPLHLTALRAEDLERELARQSVGKTHLQQGGGVGGIGSGPSQQQVAQFNLQRPGPFNNPSIPGTHSHLNRPFQRPPMNQGNFPGGPMQQQQQQQQFSHRQQQQRFMNSFHGGGNSKSSGNFNQHSLHHPHHPHPHYHNDGFGNFNHHHPHHFNNHPHHQQQNYHYHNSNHRNQESGGGGHYFNHNGYERRGFDRRPFDQNKSQYDRGGGERRDDHGGGRTRRDSEAEWEEWHRKREQDEYCGLMTPREKGWLKYIQAMQLHSDSPYQDDYYYVMHSVKQQRKREEEVIEIDGLQLLLPDRGKDGGREYEPPRLENSLGKLQVVSVNAPRKIIDLQVVHLDPSHPTTPLQREMRKHRHLLLYVEKLFNVMMELDDLERKIRHLPDCPTRDLFRTKSRQQAARLWRNITVAPETLIQLLCVRKGKSLLCRVMRWLGEEECAKLVGTVMQNMPLLSKRDAHDQHLALFWPLTDRLVAAAPHVRLLDLATALTTATTTSSSQNTAQKTNLTTALGNKYGVSLVLAMMVRGEQLQASLAESEAWQEFLASVVAALTSPSTFPDSNRADMPQALPSVALAASPFPPAHHLSRCHSQADPKAVRAAQDRMALLEASNVYKPSSQTPVKS